MVLVGFFIAFFSWSIGDSVGDLVTQSIHGQKTGSIRVNFGKLNNADQFCVANLYVIQGD